MNNLNLIDYKIGQRLACIPFAALISAAMRKADSNNLRYLEQYWPGLYKDLQARYNAGGGFLADEQDIDEERVEQIVESYFKGIGVNR